MSEDTYEGERVTYECGTVLYIERVHPRSFSICTFCKSKYPTIVHSERARHMKGECVGMERETPKPVKTETREIVKTMMGNIPFYGSRMSGGEEE